MILDFYLINNEELVAVKSPAKTTILSYELVLITVIMGQITWIDRDNMTKYSDLKDDGGFGIKSGEDGYPFKNERGYYHIGVGPTTSIKP